MKRLFEPLLTKLFKKKELTKTESLVQKHIEETHNNTYIEIHDSDDDEDEHEGYLYTGTL